MYCGTQNEANEFWKYCFSCDFDVFVFPCAGKRKITYRDLVTTMASGSHSNITEDALDELDFACRLTIGGCFLSALPTAEAYVVLASSFKKSESSIFFLKICQYWWKFFVLCTLLESKKWALLARLGMHLMFWNYIDSCHFIRKMASVRLAIHDVEEDLRPTISKNYTKRKPIKMLGFSFSRVQQHLQDPSNSCKYISWNWIASHRAR